MTRDVTTALSKALGFARLDSGLESTHNRLA